MGRALLVAAVLLGLLVLAVEAGTEINFFFKDMLAGAGVAQAPDPGILPDPTRTNPPTCSAGAGAR